MCMTVMQVPPKTHWLGTDTNGMDMLTRLMYGGRVSLVIGFHRCVHCGVPGRPAGRRRRLLRQMGG